jgi:hypothetical protein
LHFLREKEDGEKNRFELHHLGTGMRLEGSRENFSSSKLFQTF